MIEILDEAASGECIRDLRSDELFTSWDWLSLIQESYAIPIRAVVDYASGAVLPVGIVDDLAGRRLLTLPFSDYVMLPFGLDMALRLAELALQEFHDYSFAARIAATVPEFGTRGQWSIKASAVHHRAMPAANEQQWAALSQSFRRQVRIGKRHGVTTRVARSFEAVERFYSLHTFIRNHKFHQIPQPRHFFRGIYERFFTSDRGFVFETYHKDVVVAACLMIQHGNTLYYKFSASSLDAHPVRGNNVMLWELLRYASEHGWVLDLGRSGLSEDYAGLLRFKDSLGATRYPILTCAHGPRQVGDAAARRTSEFRALAGRLSERLASSKLDESGNDAVAALLYRYFA